MNPSAADQPSPYPAAATGDAVPYPAVQQPHPSQAPTQGPVVGGSQPPHAPTVHPRTNPNSTQNALQIAEIRDGVVIMNDGSFRSVVMVKSVNFDLMSPGEQEAIEFAYQAS